MCSGRSEAMIDSTQLDSGLCVRALGRDRLKRKAINVWHHYTKQGWSLFSPMQCLENCGWKALCYQEFLYSCHSWMQKLNATVRLQSSGLLVTCQGKLENKLFLRCSKPPCFFCFCNYGISHGLMLSFSPLSFSFRNWNNIFPVQYLNCLEPAPSLQLSSQ